MRTNDQIFRDGSTTYYWSSRFFSKGTREDVLKLYSFVRIADDCVDAVPQNIKSFKKLERTWRSKKDTKVTDELTLAVANMREVATKYDFDPAWVDAFLDSMRMDTKDTTYTSMNITLKYIYGSAEVIGLMMSKILGVPAEAYKYAKLQGRAMQYINFIRDIDEDIALGRLYFPKKEFRKFGLPELTAKEVYKHPGAFREFIESQIDLYNEWQTEANKGFKYIPRRERIALRTAVDMYNWTSQQIAANPFVVFKKKVKPSKVRVVVRALLRCIYA